MADSQRSGESAPLYHDIPAIASTSVRVTAGFTVVMVILSFIFCLVKGSSNHTFYLLACNLVISSIIAITTAWWYRNGALEANKYWYVILVGAVIIFQCLTTDVYVFSLPHRGEPVQPTTTASSLVDVIIPSH